MEKDISFNYENIYVNMDENEENHTKKLLNDHVATDSFFCSNIFNCLFGCCFLLCS